MKISDKVGYHALIYKQFYPAILGSMLYDLLHLKTIVKGSFFSDLFAFQNIDEIFCLKLSITLFYCLDFMHLHSDLKSDDERYGVKLGALILDFFIAVILGIAYWFASDGKYLNCYVFWSFVPVIFLFYNIFSKRFTCKSVMLYCLLSVSLFIAAYLHRDNQESFSLIIFSVISLGIYSIIIFTYNEKNPPTIFMQ